MKPARFLSLWIQGMNRAENRLRAKIGPARNAYLRRAAEQYLTTGDVTASLEREHAVRIEGILAQHYKATIPAFRTLTRAQISGKGMEKKAAGDRFSERELEWVRTQALAKAKTIAKTDIDEVRGVISQGIADGIGTESVATSIRKRSDLTPWRAATIARTEAHAAATYANKSTADDYQQEFGVALKKRWLAVSDNRTRESHISAGRGPAIEMDDYFDVDGDRMDGPHDESASPENVINCRCTLIHTVSGF
jgi:uncharacterized protein with gpF-like domain